MKLAEQQQQLQDIDLFGNVSSNEKGLNNKYNEKAEAIYKNWDLTWEQKKNKLNKLLQKYAKEVIESEAKQL